MLVYRHGFHFVSCPQNSKTRPYVLARDHLNNLCLRRKIKNTTWRTVFELIGNQDVPLSSKFQMAENLWPLLKKNKWSSYRPKAKQKPTYSCKVLLLLPPVNCFLLISALTSMANDSVRATIPPSLHFLLASLVAVNTGVRRSQIVTSVDLCGCSEGQILTHYL